MPSLSSATIRTHQFLLAVLAASFLFTSNRGYAAPLTQVLAKNSSVITFGVESPSPTLQMKGRLYDFNGTVSLTPNSAAVTDLQLTVNISSAELPPEQFLQGVFLRSIISRFKSRVATFRSKAINHVKGNNYVAMGIYSWQGRTRSATVPFQLIHASATKTEINILLRGELPDTSAFSELSAPTLNAPQPTGWAQATLFFIRSKLS